MTLGYEAFARLLKLKMTLSRSAHTAEARHKMKLRQAIDHIDRALAHCEDYEAHIRRYASVEKLVG
ncbi:MAG: hypothetical protein HY718_12330 [Planctomycetes bacterium]|nr:hypothetical protein [Planctomycetota bacterium]